MASPGMVGRSAWCALPGATSHNLSNFTVSIVPNMHHICFEAFSAVSWTCVLRSHLVPILAFKKRAVKLKFCEGQIFNYLQTWI